MSQRSTYSNWKAIVRSAIGTDHSQSGVSCQDYADYTVWDDYLIGAVADGASSCRYSQEGSKLAVELALYYVEETLKKYKSLLNSRSIFEQMITYIKEGFEQKAIELSRLYQKNIFVKDLSCTLLVFIASPRGIAAMQLGDGFIVVRYQRSQQYNLLFSPSKGEHNNETVFITASDRLIQDALQVTYLNKVVSFVCASTDGLEDVALTFSKGSVYQPFHDFFVPVEKYMQKTPNPDRALDNWFNNWLNSPAVNEKTNDDKTILVISSFTNDPCPEMQGTHTPSSTPRTLPRSRTPEEVLGRNLGFGQPLNPSPLPPPVVPPSPVGSPQLNPSPQPPNQELNPIDNPVGEHNLINGENTSSNPIKEPVKSDSTYVSVPVYTLALSFFLLYVLGVLFSFVGSILENYDALNKIYIGAGVGRVVIGSIKGFGIFTWLIFAGASVACSLHSIRLLRGNTIWKQPAILSISGIKILKITAVFLVPIVSLAFSLGTSSLLGKLFPFTVCTSFYQETIASSPMPICVPDNVFNEHNTTSTDTVSPAPTDTASPTPADTSLPTGSTIIAPPPESDSR